MLQNFKHLPKFSFLFPIWKYYLGIAISYLVIFFLITSTTFGMFLLFEKASSQQISKVDCTRVTIWYILKIPSPGGKNLISFKVIVKPKITKQTPLMASFCRLIKPAAIYLPKLSLLLAHWLFAKFHRGKINRFCAISNWLLILCKHFKIP